MSLDALGCFHASCGRLRVGAGLFRRGGALQELLWIRVGYVKCEGQAAGNRVRKCADCGATDGYCVVLGCAH
jgi:hypothetical protein